MIDGIKTLEEVMRYGIILGSKSLQSRRQVRNVEHYLVMNNVPNLTSARIRKDLELESLCCTCRKCN